MFSVSAVEKLYSTLDERHALARRRLGRPITLAEKILFAHLDAPESAEYERNKSYLMLRPDRVALQDATAQMALLQFMLAGRDEAAVPSTIHCDHLIRAQKGSEADMGVALAENKEVFDF